MTNTHNTGRILIVARAASFGDGVGGRERAVGEQATALLPRSDSMSLSLSLRAR
jgi:hypothetical protein